MSQECVLILKIHLHGLVSSKRMTTEGKEEEKYNTIEIHDSQKLEQVPTLTSRNRMWN